MSATFKDEIVSWIPKLRAYAIVLTGSTFEADDLVQDTLVRAWRFRSSYQPGTHLRAWLFKILRNEFLSGVKRQKPLHLDDDMATRLASPPEQEWRVRCSELLEGISSLPPHTRDALLLVVGSGFTYEEAATICDCSVGTIKSRISRARERLSASFDAPDPPTRNERAMSATF